MAHLKRSEKVLTHNTAALCLGGDVGISSSGPHQIHPGSPLARIEFAWPVKTPPLLSP